MFQPLDLTGRTVLVTGASSGIGRETARYLARLNARVVLVGRRAEALEAAAGELEGAGHRPAAYDLHQTEGIPAWMKQLATEIGPFSGVVHSAGVHSLVPLRFLTESGWNEVQQINVLAAVQLAKGLRQKGVAARPASIVLLSSVMGLVGQAGVPAYVASKGAIVALTRGLALELAAESIRVNCVAPGQVKTEMTAKQHEKLTAEQVAAIASMHPLGFGEPQDVAAAIAFLLADTARWITGTTLVVDGGYTAH